MKQQLFVIISLIVCTSFCDTVSQLFLKASINSLGCHIDGFKKMVRFILSLARIPGVWISFLFSTLSLFIWLFVLGKADLNFAFSVDSMHYILIALASRMVLKEKVTAARWAGTGLIVLGIALVTLS